MSSPKCRSVEVINNSARPGSNHMEVNYINYKQQQQQQQQQQEKEEEEEEVDENYNINLD